MRYGLIGEKLSHSYSKIIHEMLGYKYELIPLSRNELDKFLRLRDFNGLNVTIPYKKTVMDYCDELDEKASMIGAVNTLYIKDGKLYGTNTDYDGFLYMIRRCGLDFSGKKILICGNGGASAMAQKASVDLGASSVFVASRKTAEASRKTGSVNFISYSEIPEDIQIIVNATPVGTYPHNGERLLDISPYYDLIGAVDIIYNPFLTDLLLQARKRNIKYTNGLPMNIAKTTTATIPIIIAICPNDRYVVASEMPSFISCRSVVVNGVILCDNIMPFTIPNPSHIEPATVTTKTRCLNKRETDKHVKIINAQ